MRWVAALIVVSGGSCRINFDPAPPTEVTVAITGAGAGAVVDPGSGISCSASCTTSIAPGTVLHPSAVASAGSWFRGWTSTCTGRHGCDLTVGDQPITITADFTPEPNRMFVSSTTHDGNFSSLAEGGALCTMLANATGLTGSYAILLSTSTASFSSQLAGARGWIRPDGEPVGDSVADATGGSVRAAIRITETGSDVGTAAFWAPSYVANDNCGDWASTASTGRSIGTERGADYQSGGGSTSCATAQHFLCAEIDRVQPVDPIPDVGRHAFTSVTLWPDSAGLAAADATCAGDAATAGLPGTYRALVAASGATALSRFDLTARRGSGSTARRSCRRPTPGRPRPTSWPHRTSVRLARPSSTSR